MKKNIVLTALIAAFVFAALPSCQLDEVTLQCPVVTSINKTRAAAGEEVVVSVENLLLKNAGSYELRVGDRPIAIRSLDTVNQRVVFAVPQGMKAGRVSLRLKQFSCDSTGSAMAGPYLEYILKADQVKSSVFAGSLWQGDYVNGQGTNARFNAPGGLAVDTITGSIFIADLNNYRVRLADTLGNVSVFAGNGVRSCMANSANKFNSSFKNPGWLSYSHSSKNLYLSDRQCNMLYEISTGTNEFVGGGDNDGGGCFGNGTVQLSAPEGVAVSGSEELYCVDSGAGIIRRSEQGTTCNITMPSTAYQPFSLALDEANGLLYFSDFNTGDIYRMSTENLQPEKLVFTSGSATIGNPAGLAVGPDGKLFIADATEGKVLQYYRQSGILEELSLPFASDLVEPWGLAYDHKRGKLYLSDRQLHVLFVICLS
ncbi:MAG: NHL repeat-containing protein [Phaeodactylibacter sp.]|nr:NHL repeat-containing protein [Phaeodactylibacter sp.]MCB9276823.1 NHL repeat-containing protein [Lewinellaceae bacterium]